MGCGRNAAAEQLLKIAVSAFLGCFSKTREKVAVDEEEEEEGVEGGTLSPGGGGELAAAAVEE